LSADGATELEDAYEELLRFVYATPVGLLELDASGAIGIANPVAMQLLLQFVPPEGLTNFFSVMEVLAPELRNLVDGFRPAAGIVCENHRIFAGPASRREAAESKVLGCTLVKLGPNRLMAALLDISVQIAQERRLNEAEAWFSSLIDDSNDFAVVMLDAAGRISAANDSVLQQTGLTERDTIGQQLDIFEADDLCSSRTPPAEKLAAARRNGWHLEEGWHKTGNGGRYWCQMLVTVRAGAEESPGSPIAGYTAILRRAQQHQFNSANLKQLLTTDHLTGARNRAHFFEVAERECLRAIRFGQPLSVIMLDVDHFKHVNDRHGHPAGDETLKTLAQACSRLIRNSDVFARVGGEEFAVLLPATDLQSAAETAEKLRACVAATEIRAANATLQCTISLGCAALNAEARDIPTLLAAADAALYKAKHSGRNRVVVANTRQTILEPVSIPTLELSAKGG
jgi:diguanylate cyclase (GGDEF)-like protein/PAS domain S-box-containing protein